jgi:hypothetical protein
MDLHILRWAVLARSATMILGIPGGHDGPPLEMPPTRSDNKAEQSVGAEQINI